MKYTVKQLNELLHAKLKSSGIDPKQGKELKFWATDSAKSVDPTFHDLPALIIPYHTFAGKPTKFYRVRYLAEPIGFGQLTKKGNQRYTQPPKTGVHAYFPPTTNWVEVIKDPSQSICITEGELKAAKASLEGLATIGLGGVYSWKNTRLGISFLPELKEIKWVGRNVYIVFDSDYKTKPMVGLALEQLSAELTSQGAIPVVVTLPDGENGSKTGLDDYLVSEGAVNFVNLALDGTPAKLALDLWKFNSEVCFIRDPGLIVVQHDGSKLETRRFTEAHYANRFTQEQTVTMQGVKMKKVPLARAWIQWPHRYELKRLTYAPGEEQVTERDEWNLWPGWGVEPEVGRDTRAVWLWQQLLNHLFQGAPKEDRVWFERWLAYPLQYPGTKLFTAAVLHTVTQGVGKSLVGYTMGRIYGANFGKVNQQQLHSPFNEWAINKQFIMGDDVTGTDKRQQADIFKNMITQLEVRVNVKYLPSYEIPDRINYLFTSNQPDAFFLEDKDRRFFIHEIQVPPLDDEFYKEYEEVMLNGEIGPAALFQYFLDLDLGQFNPSAPAQSTLAKGRMTADVKSDLGAWVSWLKHDPEAVLKMGDMPLQQDLFTNTELLQLYDPLGRTGTTSNGLGRELRRAGFKYANEGVPIRARSCLQRYYIIRNETRWLSVKVTEMMRHLNDGIPGSKGEKVNGHARY